MARYEVYLSVGLFDALPKTGTRRRAILDFIRSLHEQPNTPGDFVEQDASSREVQVKLVGGYAVSYWLDDPVKIVMIAKVEPAD